MADLIADPFRAARLVLHLRQEGVTDDGVLKAMETIDRGAFIDDPGLARMAFDDCVLPIACGQIVPRPAVTGHLLQALNLRPVREHRVLVVGVGSGYTATLIAQLAADVFAIERYKRLTDHVRQKIIDLALPNLAVRHEDGLLGWPERGPFSRILLTGQVSEVPETLLAQLTPSGFLLAPMPGPSGSEIVKIKLDGTMERLSPIESLPHLSSGKAAAL